MTDRIIQLHPRVNARFEHLFPKADLSRFVAEAMTAACRERERELEEERWATVRARSVRSAS